MMGVLPAWVVEEIKYAQSRSPNPHGTKPPRDLARIEDDLEEVLGAMDRMKDCGFHAMDGLRDDLRDLISERAAVTDPAWVPKGEWL